MPPDAPLWESHLLPRRKTCTSRIAHTLVGAVGIEHDPLFFKSRDLTALQPPTEFNC